MNKSKDIVISKKNEELEHNPISIPFSDDFVLDELDIEFFNDLLKENTIESYEMENTYL